MADSEDMIDVDSNGESEDSMDNVDSDGESEDLMDYEEPKKKASPPKKKKTTSKGKAKKGTRKTRVDQVDSDSDVTGLTPLSGKGKTKQTPKKSKQTPAKAKQTPAKKTKQTGGASAKQPKTPTKLSKDKPARNASTKKKNSPSEGVKKKTYRYRPGTVVLKEIRKYQRSPDPLIRKAPFIRLMRQIMKDRGIITEEDPIRVSAQSVSIMRQMVENHLIGILKDSNTIASHAKRVTVTSNDMQIIKGLRK